MGPSDLAQVLRRLESEAGPPNAALLVGTDTGDDAAVWRLDDERALVFTADFFTPIVDDPAAWGRIGAANAMSDVYAMGGRPVLCLNLVGWPRDALSLDILGEVLAGGVAKAREAGAVVAGGHTVDDPEPKYGMAVVGLAHPDSLVTNAAARPGDRLLLTKPIGSGVVTTAIKNERARPEWIAAAVESMEALNAGAGEAMVAAGIRAGTDVTGFGLLGHLQRMLAASGAGATIGARRVPVLPGAAELARAGQIAGGSRRNRAFLEEWVTWDGDVGEEQRVLLTDAQTSGGMLIACPPERLGALGTELATRAVPSAEIGVATDASPGSIAVTAE